MKRYIFIVVKLLLIFNLNAQWVSLSSGTTNTLEDIFFTSIDTGYVVGENNTLLKTSDAGNSWTSLPIIGNMDFKAIHFKNSQEGFAVGDNGMLYTQNAGQNWQTVSIPTTEELLDITFINDQIGIAVGKNTAMIRTINGGLSWQNISNPATRNISAIHFPHPDTGYAVQSGYNWGFLKTIDAGQSWILDTIKPINGWSSLEAVFFTTPQKGFVGGWYLAAFAGTDNGGTDWHDLNATFSADLYSICFSDMQHGYAVGLGDQIYHTSDGGNSWHTDSVANNGYMVVYCAPGNAVYVAGYNGIILKKTVVTSTRATVKHEYKVSVFPNPTKDRISFELPYVRQDIQLMIYNHFGQLVHHEKIESAQTTIKTHNWPSSSYYYQFKTPSKQLYKGTFIKKD